MKISQEDLLRIRLAEAQLRMLQLEIMVKYQLPAEAAIDPISGEVTLTVPPHPETSLIRKRTEQENGVAAEP